MITYYNILKYLKHAKPRVKFWPHNSKTLLISEGLTFHPKDEEKLFVAAQGYITMNNLMKLRWSKCLSVRYIMSRISISREVMEDL